MATEEKTARKADKLELITSGKAAKITFNPNKRVPDVLNMKTGAFSYFQGNV